MLINDGKPIMREDDFFDNKGYFRGKEHDDTITKNIIQQTRGYVSFVRGKNPLNLRYIHKDKVTKKNDFPINDKDCLTN